jgi:hypothetical protein
MLAAQDQGVGPVGQPRSRLVSRGYGIHRVAVHQQLLDPLVQLELVGLDEQHIDRAGHHDTSNWL